MAAWLDCSISFGDGELAVISRKNHLEAHGNRDTAGLAVFVGCRLVSLHIFHPKIPREASTQTKGLCSPSSAQSSQQSHIFHFSRGDNVV